MEEQRGDTFFRITGMVGLAVLLLFTLWMRSSDQQKVGGSFPGTTSGNASATSGHAHAPHQGAAGSGETYTGQSGILLPGGTLSNGVREISYEAFQYGFDPNPLIVRAGEKIRLFVKSRDVEHGMMIPEVNFNAPMPLGKAKAVEFTAPAKAGEYPIFCSVFCGADHGAMTGALIVLPADGQSVAAPAVEHPESGDAHADH